jgi:hypothetical protein
LGGKEIQFFLILGHGGVEVIEKADSEVKKSKKADSQMLIPMADLKAQWKKRKGKEELLNL